MVVFLDLEDEGEPPEQLVNGSHWTMQHHGNVGQDLLRGLSLGSRVRGVEVDGEQMRENPNKEKSVTEALACYPIIASIASHIDLNTLDALSLTCRQIRANLLQFRNQLIISTLHCENQDVAPDPEHTFRYRARAADWYFVESGRESIGSGAGKFGDCARDMVGECRRCKRVVCRNCAIKPPAPILLRHRHRRICTACTRAPLSSLINPTPHTHDHHSPPPSPTTLSPETLARESCACPTSVWLCQPCGRSLRSADVEYESIWKWRTRYLPSLGGLGVGFGEGNRGVPCGRGAECVAAKEVESEVDCDAEDARDSNNASPEGSPGNHQNTAGGSSGGSNGGGSGNGNGISRHGTPSQMGPGYARHEIEGIGGRVKTKLVRMVRVGACVPEFEGEKNRGVYLSREQEGRARSWCGWCWRVVPGVKDGVAQAGK